MKNTLLFLFLTLAAFCNAQWKTVYTGSHMVASLQFVNANIAYAVGDSVFLKSTDGGDSWTDLTTNITVTDPSFDVVFFVDANVGYIGRTNNTGGANLLKTINGGQTWTNVSSPNMTQGVTNLYFLSPNVGYATGGFGAGNVFAKTTDGGDSWTKTSTPADDASAIIHFINDSTGFSGTSLIMRTHDRGNTWIPTKMPVLDKNNAIVDIYFVNANTGYALTYNHNVVLKTTDGGNTWVAKPTGKAGVLAKDIGFTDANAGYIISYSSGLFATQNGGDNWAADTTFPKGHNTSSLAAMQDKVIVGSIQGNIFMHKKSLAGIEAPAAVNFDIYPNPATAQIHFTNPTGQPLSITIYDAMGRKVADENNIYTTMKINLPAAIYYCHINAGNAVYAKKLVVE